MRELKYRWEWVLDARPDALWPLVADTNRFNRDAGVPPVNRIASDGGRRRLRLSRFGVPIEWEEEPFEWIRPRRFSVARRYLRGPLAELRVAVELTPLPEGETQLVYEVRARPRNLLGLVAVPLQMRLSKRRFTATFRRYEGIAGKEIPTLVAPRPVRFVPGGRARLAAGIARLVEEGADSELAERLADLVEHGDELVLGRLRPYALADEWGAGRREVLELCLRATRAGLLRLSWDLLCPLCRGPAESGSTLGEIGSRVHCESCNIDATVAFDRSVELTFRPSESVRRVERVSFCVGGPGLTPHVVTQQLLPPGATRTIAPRLEPGRYRVRAQGLPDSQALVVAQRGASEATVTATASGWPAEELSLDEGPSLRLENATDAEQLLVLERTAWSDQAATAAEVTALQLFRDLFASEALRPGEPIDVGSLTIAFTDLRDSTRFYREVGDAPAFGSVLAHLDRLRDAVAQEEGALVKTMGDAIMAVFPRPAGAVRALLAAQRELAAGSPRLLLKAGIHSGPCIAVNQNGRLDYFGTAVNLAARLVSLSSGDDVVVSGAVLADPEVADLLAGGELEAEPLEATLKGFDADRFELWRLRQ